MSLDDQPDLDPALADAVRRAYVRPVDEDTARRHVSAMAAGAPPADLEPVLRWPRRGRVWRSALAAGVAALSLPAGLAVAGVSLPSVVERPYHAVGITLPHQTGDETSAPEPGRRPVAPITTPERHRPRTPRQSAGVNRRQPAKRQGQKPGSAGRPGRSSGTTTHPAPNAGGSAKSHAPGAGRSALQRGKLRKTAPSGSSRARSQAGRRASGASEPAAPGKVPGRGGG